MRTVWIAATLGGALLATAAPARAGGLTLGVSLGQTDGDELDRTEGIGGFGRWRVGGRAALEVEASRSAPDDEAFTSRRLGGALLLDLGDRGASTVTPYLLAGGGVMRTESAYWIGDHRHLEVGAGLDVAVGKRLWLGVDARLGRRELVHEGSPDGVVILIYAPALPAEHDYRAVRVTLSFGL